MNNVIICGTLNNTDEIKMYKDLEVLEFKVEGIKCKAFGKLANEIKNMKGMVIVSGEINLKDYTNKDGRTYPIQVTIVYTTKGIKSRSASVKGATKSRESNRSKMPP